MASHLVPMASNPRECGALLFPKSLNVVLFTNKEQEDATNGAPGIATHGAIGRFSVDG